MKELGDKFRKARKDKGLRLCDVQDAIGITTVTVSAIETGKQKNPQIETLMKLADLYEKEIRITLENK